MCLRYAFTTTDFKLLMERFRLKAVRGDIKPRYNIAPTQGVPVVFNDNEGELVEAKWGLAASWHEKSGAGHLLFNARAESIDSKPSFRKDFEGKRCLMLADSFYEWKHPEKRPFRLSLKGGVPFAFAGIYGEGKEGRACCMITTGSNELVSKVHNRMPAILPNGAEREWLEAGAEEAKGLLRPYPASGMEMYELTSSINSSRNDSPDVIRPKTSKGTLAEFMK
jgi:putative SOS response-associated peptidase YedK